MSFIDPPSPFAPLRDWEEFLKEMQSVRPVTPDIEAAIAEAKKQIAEKKTPGN